MMTNFWFIKVQIPYLKNCYSLDLINSIFRFKKFKNTPRLNLFFPSTHFSSIRDLKILASICLFPKDFIFKNSNKNLISWHGQPGIKIDDPFLDNHFIRLRTAIMKNACGWFFWHRIFLSYNLLTSMVQ